MANALDLGDATENFRAWGYPRGWRFVTAAVELGGAGVLLSARARPVGLLVLGVTITAAIVTLVRHKAGAAHLAPAVGFVALLAATVVLDAGALR